VLLGLSDHAYARPSAHVVVRLVYVNVTDYDAFAVTSRTDLDRTSGCFSDPRGTPRPLFVSSVFPLRSKRPDVHNAATYCDVSGMHGDQIRRRGRIDV